MNSQLLSSPSLLGQCIRGCRGKKLAEVLAVHAVNVVLAQRILGSRVAATQLGTILFDHPKMSATPVDTVVKWVESGEIPMTEATLRAAALADETASKFFALNPWLTDPTGKSIPRTKGRKSQINAAPKPPQPLKKDKPTPKAKTVAPPRAVDPVVEPAESTPEEIPEEEIEANGDKPPKRATVVLPPDYKPEEYLQKPPPTLTIPICGLSPTCAD